MEMNVGCRNCRFIAKLRKKAAAVLIETGESTIGKGGVS